MTPPFALRHLSARLGAAAWPLRLLLLAALGAVAALGLPPWNLPAATLAALVLLFLLVQGGRMGFRAGWAFGLGWFALALHWIVEPFLVDPERTGWMAPFALVITAGGFALFPGAAFGLAGRLRLGLPGLVALWGGVEAFRSLAFTGFPWALPGHVWIGTPLIRLGALGGAHGLTLLTLGAAALIAAPRVPGALRAGVVAALAAGVFFLEPGPAPAPEPGAPVVRVVQPNVPQAEKWDPDLMPMHLRDLLELTRGEGPADLVLWPETALPMFLNDAGPFLAEAAEAAGGAPLLAGAAREAEGRYHNSLVLLGEGGEALAAYDKVHLVPFGEYMPFRDLLSRWGLRGVAEFQGEGFTPGQGEGQAVLDIPGIGPARALICYEGIFPEEILGGERPRLLLLATNDAWFGQGAGPGQHLALGRLRAVELGLPLVRAANTGISAVIDAEGRVLASLPLGIKGSIDVVLPPARPATVYARLGDLPVFLLLLLLGLWGLWGRMRGPNRGGDLDPGHPRS